MLMERVIQLVADLPNKSATRVDLTNRFVDQLFNSLQHPPLSYLGGKFRYRQADGSYNNIMYPHIGAANTPYARTVIPETVQPGALPDPGLVFDSLFAREAFRPHSNRNSSIIFYWASLVIHDLFLVGFSHDQSRACSDQYHRRRIMILAIPKRPLTWTSPHSMEIVKMIKTRSGLSKMESSSLTALLSTGHWPSHPAAAFFSSCLIVSTTSLQTSLQQSTKTTDLHHRHQILMVSNQNKCGQSMTTTCFRRRD